MWGWTLKPILAACGYALANKGIDTRTLQAYLGTLDQLDHALCGVGPAAVKKIRGEGVAGAPRRSKIRTIVSTGVPTLAPRFAKLILENLIVARQRGFTAMQP
jgi:hypothetical protein